MPLTLIEQLALWGPPVVILLLSAGYYFRWGREAEETERTGSRATSEGGDA